MIDYNVGNHVKKRSKSSSEIDNGVDIPQNKRAKTTDSSVEFTIDSVTIWGCNNRQLNELVKINLGLAPCFNTLIEQMCTTFRQQITENVLSKQYEDDTWSEIYVKDENIALSELKIKSNDIISIGKKERILTSLTLDDVITEINPNAIEKTYLIIKDVSSDRDIKIEYDQNDTIYMLKENILTQFQFNFNIEHLQLNIDSKIIDITCNDRTLVSLNLSPLSMIIVNKREKSKSKTMKYGHCGLRNLGNTCFMNSALQCMSNIKILTDYFLEHKNVHGEVAQAYSDFIQNVWSDKKLFVPQQIKRTISHYAPQFADFDQQDAHEFMIFLLNQLHHDLKQEQTTASIISKLFHGHMDGVTTCLTCKNVRRTSNLINFIPLSLDENKKKRVFKIIFEPIHPVILTLETNASGYIENLVEEFIDELQRQKKYSTEKLFERSRVVSACNNEDLPFSLPLNNILDTDLKFVEQQQILRKAKIKKKDNNSLNIINCLREFIALEILDGPWFCKSNCNQLVHAAKQMQLSILPSVLIIQLKRFTNENGHRRKLNTFVDFPIDGLDLTEFITDQQANVLYDLIAVSNHMGTIDRGHYTSYARQLATTPVQWYRFNDEEVLCIEESEVISSSAYILIYIKREEKETSH